MINKLDAIGVFALTIKKLMRCSQLSRRPKSHRGAETLRKILLNSKGLQNYGRN